MGWGGSGLVTVPRVSLSVRILVEPVSRVEYSPGTLHLASPPQGNLFCSPMGTFLVPPGALSACYTLLSPPGELFLRGYTLFPPGARFPHGHRGRLSAWCVILYFYPATCGPKAHGSSAAAEAAVLLLQRPFPVPDRHRRHNRAPYSPPSQCRPFRMVCAVDLWLLSHFSVCSSTVARHK